MRLTGSRLQFLTIIFLLLVLAVAIFNSFGDRVWGKPIERLPPCQKSAPILGGQTFYIDPVKGTDGGDGSEQRPWRSLQRTIDAKLVGSQTQEIGRVQYWTARLLGHQAEPRLFQNHHAVVGDGDTILLSSGDHGTLDLHGIVNRAAITIRGSEGADARLSSIQMEGAANFAFKNLAVHAAMRNSDQRFLVSLRPSSTARRSSNISFHGLRVGGSNSISAFDRGEWARRANDGILLFGDCLNFQASAVHDVHSGVALYHVNDARIENVEIRNFSVDGITFSGNDIVIKDNLIHDHWPTGDDLHPDCMQGQTAPGDPMFGRVSIEGNICLSDTEARRSDILQGINIFNGHWSDVTIRCNFVRPTIWHGISLYGADNVKIEHNIVIGWPGVNTPWIASMPSGDQRQPKANMITGNLAPGYLNAIHGGPYSVDAMFRNLQINPQDNSIQTTLSQKIDGVTLRDNAWLNPTWDMSLEKRFKPVRQPEYSRLVSLNQAKAEIAAIADCNS